MNNDLDIKQIYQEMELELIHSMKRNLSRHLKEESKTGFEFPQWQAMTLKEIKRFESVNKSIIGDYTKGLNSQISKQLKDELKQGSKKEMKRYKQVMGDKYKANKALSGSFFNLNDKKLISLINEIQNGTKNTNTGALRMMNDQYRKVISKAVIFSNHGVVSPTKAIDMATKEFLSAGINCIEYKNGARVNIASYCEMAVRTANTRAQLIGEGQFRQEIGEHLVKPTRHNTSCEKCAKWEGKVLIDDVYSGGSKKDGNYPLLSQAMQEGFFHPRCEHSLPTYYKEIEDIDFDEHGPTKETMRQYQEDLNWINNNIQKYERLVAGSIDKENIQKYKTKKRLYEEKRSEVLKIIYEPKYKDITQDWLNNATPNSHRVLDMRYFEHNGTKYNVDNKKVVLDYSKHEKEVAEWLETTFGGEIYMVPRINNPEGIKTADFLFRKEYWDLKDIVGDGKHTLDSAIKKKKSQSSNFVFDLSKSKMTNDEAIKQLNLIFKSKDRQWLDKIILKRNKNVVVILKHKKRD